MKLLAWYGSNLKMSKEGEGIFIQLDERVPFTGKSLSETGKKFLRIEMKHYNCIVKMTSIRWYFRCEASYKEEISYALETTVPFDSLQLC